MTSLAAGNARLSLRSSHNPPVRPARVLAEPAPRTRGPRVVHAEEAAAGGLRTMLPEFLGGALVFACFFAAATLL